MEKTCNNCIWFDNFTCLNAKSPYCKDFTCVYNVCVQHEAETYDDWGQK